MMLKDLYFLGGDEVDELVLGLGFAIQGGGKEENRESILQMGPCA